MQGQTDRLYRHLVAARLAAAHKDLCSVVDHADRALAVVDQFRPEDPLEPDPRLDLVVAAVELGVPAARRRNWRLAYDTLDLVHSLVVENHDPEFYERAFWVPFAQRWPQHLAGQLGGAAKAMGISGFSSPG